MHDVGEWLAGLGLGRYAPAFAEHAIDARLLPTLTAGDLRELGVASVGHRRRLLNAIAALDPPVPAERREPERRRLTVMFVDLVDSTSLARRLDPEDMSAVIRRFQEAVATEIGRMDGHLAKFMGDGVLAYFGWPRAHEDEAERAVRAALAVTGAVGRLNLPAGGSLAARAGIATGPVVVGEAIGEGSAREETVVGETPSLAARLQGLAPPGGTLVAGSTRQLLGGLFDLETAGSLALKGFDDEVEAWLVRGEAPGRARFEARRGGEPAALVGRDRELDLLMACWSRARGGAGQAVLLAGEAGIGKSRLLRALQESAAAGPAQVVVWQASPFHTGNALWPVVQLVAGGEAPTEPRAGDAGLDSETQRHRLLATLLDHFSGLAGRAPLLLVLEDAHWADPTTLELTRSLLGRIAGLPVLLVVSTRPEGRPELPAVPHLTELALGRLDRPAVEQLVAQLSAGNPESGALLDTVAGRTDGVPLFIEELTKELIARGGDLGDDDVPASLHDTLMARLDRIPEAKEVAQIASCIGRDIDLGLLTTVAGLPPPELARRLEKLCDAGLLVCGDDSPAASYSFKHALVRDAAYASLLRSRRRTVHERILAALVDGQAEAKALHAAGAELWPTALHHSGAAGKAAIDRAAYAEGIDLLAKALEAGSRQVGDVTAEVEMIDLRRVRCWALQATGDTARLLAELRAAEAGAGRYGLARLSCQLRAHRAHVETMFGGHARRAIGYGGEAGRIAASVGDTELAAAARFVLGQAHWAAGNYQAAVAELGRDLAAYRAGLRMPRMASSGTLAVEGLAVLGGCLGQLGRWPDALAHATEAKAVAAETGRPLDRLSAEWHLARTHLAAGDVDAAVRLLEQGLELSRHFGIRIMVLWNQALLGQARVVAGRPDEALALLEAAFAGATAMRLPYTATQALLARADAGRAAGDGDAVAVAAGDGLELAQAHGYRALEATALRLLGRLDEARDIAAGLGLAPELALIEAVS